MYEIQLYGEDLKSFQKRFNLSDERMAKKLGFSRTKLYNQFKKPMLDENVTMKFLQIIAEKEKMEDDIDEIQDYIDKLRDDYDVSLSDKLDDEDDDYYSFDRFVAEANRYKINNSTTAQAPPVSNKIERLSNRILEKNLTGNEREIKDLRHKNEKLQTDLFTTKINENKLEVKVDSLNDKLNNQSNEIVELRTQMKEKDSKFEALADKLLSLETRVNDDAQGLSDSIKSQESLASIVNAIAPMGNTILEKLMSRPQQHLNPYMQQPYPYMQQQNPNMMQQPQRQPPQNTVSDEDILRDPQV